MDTRFLSCCTQFVGTAPSTSLQLGALYEITAHSAMGISHGSGVFRGYTSEGKPLFSSDTMGDVMYDPASGWTFTPVTL